MIKAKAKGKGKVIQFTPPSEARAKRTTDRRTIGVAKSYNFIDKVPIVDEIRTLQQDSGYSLKYISEKTGVCTKTMRDWFNGQTRRPQAPTLNMVLRVFGKKLGVVNL